MSGGNWTQSDAENTGTRPGIYLNFLGQAQSAVQVGAQGTVAIPATADWGLFNGITTVTAESQLLSAFGTGGNAKLLAGQALRGGASQVKVYRIGLTGTYASATLTLNATDAAAGIALTALYPGARANGFTIKVAVNANNAGLKDFQIIENSNVLETFTHIANDDLTTMINGGTVGINASKYVTAVQSGAGSRVLANQSGAAMTGGNSGTAVTATEYTNALAALETQDFNLLVPGDTVDTSIQATVQAWVVRVRSEGKKVIAVMGGQSVAGFSSSAAATEFATMQTNAKSSTIANTEGVVMVFPGIVDELTAASLSGAQTAARIAGMIGKAGFNGSITKSVTGASDVTYRLTNAQVKLGLQSGLLMTTVESGQVLVEQGINTLTTYTTTKPRTFRKIRLIRTIDAISQTCTTAASNFIVGQINNDSNGQNYTVGLLLQTLGIFQQAGAIAPGFTVTPDIANNKTADPDEFFVLMGIHPIDSLEKLFVTVQVY